MLLLLLLLLLKLYECIFLLLRCCSIISTIRSPDVNGKIVKDSSFSFQLSRLILQSGGLVHPWSFSHPARSFTGALRLASLLGCPASGSKRRVAECLANASPEDIVNRESGVTAPGEGPAPGGPVSHRHPFSPTIDGDLVAWEPREMLRRALENAGGEVKVLMGGNADEGTKALMYLLPALFPNRELGEKEEGLTKGQFEEAVDRMFQGSSQQVKNNKLKQISRSIIIDAKKWLLRIVPLFSPPCDIDFLENTFLRISIPPPSSSAYNFWAADASTRCVLA